MIVGSSADSKIKSFAAQKKLYKRRKESIKETGSVFLFLNKSPRINEFPRNK